MNSEAAERQKLSTEYERQNTAKARRRPSVLFRPTLKRAGDQWCALYGKNIQEGCVGFGDTPQDAMRAFDENWKNEEVSNV